jgi:hypothetical protein
MERRRNNVAELHITEKLVTMIDIEGADRLDPISVVLENFEPGKGRVTIRCYAQSWALNAYWGAMSGKSVEEFIMDCHPEYVMGCLTWGRQPVKKRDEAYFVRVVRAVQQALRQRATAAAKESPRV